MNLWMNRGALALLASALAFALLFSLWPQLDLAVTQRFYTPGVGFRANDSAPVVFIYDAVLWGARALLFALAGAFVAACLAHHDAAAAARRRLGFLVLAFVLGPGLIVDVALKDHWGRARPHQVTHFGGERQFTPALLPTDQCRDNCSFVSGHASAGFALAALGFLATGAARRRWFAAALVAGAVAGAVRIMQGGHFLSDIVFSFYATLAGILLAALVFRWLRWPLLAPPPPARA